MHEAAHHIAWHLYGERIQDHGRAFLGVFIDCLVKAKVAPRIALEASARAEGLRWTYPGTRRARPLDGG
jgi:predicted SprT family Zn-dependent metalloprotease